MSRKDKDNIRFIFPFEYDEYVLLFTQSVNTILEKRREKTSFVIDSLNESIIEQLYFYLRLDDCFSRDLRKGIMLMGKYDCGKTIIMQAITEMYNTVIHSLHIQRPMLKFFKSSDLQNILKAKPIGAFSKMLLIIDEFGREPKQVMDFGNLRNPMIELLCERYDNGAWTNGASNFTLLIRCAPKINTERCPETD